MNLNNLSTSIKKAEEVYSLQEYLDNCAKDVSLYASPAERLLKAIGEPELVDTSKDERLASIYGNKLIKQYKAFNNFYGIETVIEKIINYLKFSSQNLEERRQILYLFGSPGSAKSSLAERLKELMESEPIYVLAIEDKKTKKLVKSPILESPLGLFKIQDSEALNIPEYALECIPSPWAIKRLDEFDGDVSQFKVVKMWPNKLKQQAVAKTEPADENNQDISALVGKIDIRQLEYYDQSDADAYSYSGGLCRSNQGLLDFVEMFKAPRNVLHPLLEATQSKNYKPTEPGLSPIPYDGIIIAHSKEAEWDKFRNDKDNEAFLDRIYLVKVPYSLRIQEEKKIYKKELSKSLLKNSPYTEHVLDILAQFSILTRLSDPENSPIFLKLRVYDGQNIKNKYPTAKSYHEYLEEAKTDEGFKGVSTRTAFKLLSAAFNYDPAEIAADPIHMIVLLEKYVKDSDLSQELQDKWIHFIKDFITPEYFKALGKDIQTASIESFDTYAQNVFNRYFTLADFWTRKQDYRDPDTGQILDSEKLNRELEILEKKANINNPKDFRSEIVNFCWRYQAQQKHGQNPSWKEFPKMREAIEESLAKDLEKILGIISFDNVKDKDQKQKTESFLKEMCSRGYTATQVKRNVDWYNRYNLVKS